jgi:hypothetical protein
MLAHDQAKSAAAAAAPAAPPLPGGGVGAGGDDSSGSINSCSSGSSSGAGNGGACDGSEVGGDGGGGDDDQAACTSHTHEGWINVPCSCAWCGARGRAAPSTGHAPPSLAAPPTIQEDDDGSVGDADTATERRRESGGWGEWGPRQRAQGPGDWPAQRERAARKRAASEARQRASWQSAQGWPQGREEGVWGARQGDEDDEDEEPLVVATSVDGIKVRMPWAIFERWSQYRDMSPALRRAAYATDGRDLHATAVYLHGAYHQTWYDGNGDPSVKVYSAAGWGVHLASLAEARREHRQLRRRGTSPSN